MCEWKPDFDGLNERVTKIEGRMTQVEHDVGKMRSETQEGFKAGAAQMHAINVAVTNLGHDFGERMNGFDKRLVTAQGITWLYRDGYTYFEAAEKVPRERPRKAQKTAPGQHAPPPRPNLPPRLAEKREAMKSRAGRVREVNATFGPGGKVLKVEEQK